LRLKSAIIILVLLSIKYKILKLFSIVYLTHSSPPFQHLLSERLTSLGQQMVYRHLLSTASNPQVFYRNMQRWKFECAFNFHEQIIQIPNILLPNLILLISDGSVVSFQKTAVAVLASVVVFLITAVAVLMRLYWNW